jgi:hypothetical protein
MASIYRVENIIIAGSGTTPIVKFSETPAYDICPGRIVIRGVAATKCE